MKSKTVTVLFFIVSFQSAFLYNDPNINLAWPATFFGERPTGIIQLEDFRYPVYLYVPEHYKPSRPFPLVISLPGNSEDPKKHLESWTALAKQRGFIVLSPEVKLRYTDTPYQTDLWLKKIMEFVIERYGVQRRKVFLVAEGDNAHYAAYLGTKYPQDFSAVALLGGSWIGPLSGLVRFESRPVNQLPFFVSLDKQSDSLFRETENKAFELTKKGYPVYLESFEGKREGLEFRDRVFRWLEEKSQSWQTVINESQKSFKERFRKGFREFFQG